MGVAGPACAQDLGRSGWEAASGHRKPARGAGFAAARAREHASCCHGSCKVLGTRAATPCGPALTCVLRGSGECAERSLPRLAAPHRAEAEMAAVQAEAEAAREEQVRSGPRLLWPCSALQGSADAQHRAPHPHPFV
jgi:hypothetical protein